MQLHLADDKPSTIAHNPPTSAAPQPMADSDEENNHLNNTSPTQTSGSDTSEAMHTRRARIGPCRHSLLEQTSSDDDTEPTTTAPTDFTPQTETPRSDSTRQTTLHEFFSDNQTGFDDSHYIMIDFQVEQYIREAETDHQSESQLCAPIILPELRTAQRRLNTASCHGKTRSQMPP